MIFNEQSWWYSQIEKLRYVCQGYVLLICIVYNCSKISEEKTFFFLYVYFFYFLFQNIGNSEYFLLFFCIDEMFTFLYLILVVTCLWSKSSKATLAHFAMIMFGIWYHGCVVSVWSSFSFNLLSKPDLLPLRTDFTPVIQAISCQHDSWPHGLPKDVS